MQTQQIGRLLLIKKGHDEGEAIDRANSLSPSNNSTIAYAISNLNTQSK